jgi:GGDEF domain-containing protein
MGTDPVTGFGSRPALFSRLKEAVAGGSPPSVLAVFGLDGLDEFEKQHGTDATDALLARLARDLSRMVLPDGSCYTTRRRELCVVFDLPLTEVRSILSAAAFSLRRECAISGLAADLGVARLPDQACDPVAALAVADRRLNDCRRMRLRRLTAARV